MENPYKYFHNNVYGGLNLLHAAVEAGAKSFVFSSTCATYGIPERVPIDEETAQNPINPYGESKLMFEKILRWFQRIHGIKYVALRYFNAAGASERFGEHHRIETHLIPRILAVALGQSTHAEIFGTDYPTPDGTCIRDYIHVRDLAQAHILALATAESGYFNLGTGGGVSVSEVIEACRQVTEHKIPILQKSRRPGDPPRLVAASEKAKKQLGWTPKYQDIHEIVQSAWAWHAKHPNGYSD
jgi:UDP-glucose 4-epimerase